MSDAKYGRLFTERDVEMMLRVQHDRTWSAASRDMDENLPDALAPRDEEYRPLTVPDAAREADELSQMTGGLTFPADEPLYLLRAQELPDPLPLARHVQDFALLGDPDVLARWLDAVRDWQAPG